MSRTTTPGALVLAVTALLTGLADRAVADIGKIRVLTPAERTARLEQLLPRYQTPWLLPVAGPGSVADAAEAYNYALWTLASPEWQPDLVVAVEVSKLDHRINPKKNTVICRPEGGGVEVHFEHRGQSAAALAKTPALLMMRIEDASCDPASRAGETYATSYFSDGMIVLGRGTVGPELVGMRTWQAAGDFSGTYNTTETAYSGRTYPIVNLSHNGVAVARTDFLGNVFFRADGGQILETQRVPLENSSTTIGAAPEPAYLLIPGVGMLAGFMDWTTGFAWTSYSQLEDTDGRWRIWATFDLTTHGPKTGVQYAAPFSFGRNFGNPDMVDFLNRPVSPMLIETADTTELGPPGTYHFQGRATLAKGTSRLSEMLDLRGGTLRPAGNGDKAEAMQALVESQQWRWEQMETERRTNVAKKAARHAAYLREKAEEDARKDAAYRQALGEMSRIANNIRDMRTYDELRSRAIAAQRAGSQADRFGFSAPPPPPPPTYEEWKANEYLKRFRLLSQRSSTAPTGERGSSSAPASAPGPRTSSGRTAPPRRSPPPSTPGSCVTNPRATACPA